VLKALTAKPTAKTIASQVIGIILGCMCYCVVFFKVFKSNLNPPQSSEIFLLCASSQYVKVHRPFASHNGVKGIRAQSRVEESP
jgi:hypothetical protein